MAAVATTAGADAAAAREEALALAAAVAESAPGAAADWGAAVTGATTQEFFDAASRGRRWRGAPTATLSALASQRSPHATAYAEALAEVAAAACELGVPTMRVKRYARREDRSWWKPFDTAVIEVDDAEPLQRQLEHFCAVIRGGASPLVSLRDGLQNVRITEAITEAARTGRIVAIA